MSDELPTADKSVADQFRDWAMDAARDWDGCKFSDLLEHLCDRFGVEPGELVRGFPDETCDLCGKQPDACLCDVDDDDPGDCDFCGGSGIDERAADDGTEDYDTCPHCGGLG